MKIVEVQNEYYREGHENAKRVYTVRVGGRSYEQEMGYLPGRGPRAEVQS